MSLTVSIFKIMSLIRAKFHQEDLFKTLTLLQQTKTPNSR